MVAPLLAIVVTAACISPGFLWKQQGDPHPYDIMEYHLQLPREWYELGRIVPLHHNVFSYFPLNAEMQSLVAMHLRHGPWAGMYLAQFVQTGCMMLSVIAVYGAIRRLRPKDSPAFAILAAIAMAAVPWIVMLGSVSYDESALMLFGATAVAWGMVGLREQVNRCRHFILGGALAGLACGVKYTAAPFLLVGIPVAAMGAVLLGSLRRAKAEGPDDAVTPLKVIGHVSMFAAAGVLVFSPWLVKNLVWARNPVFPLAMRVVGHAHFSETQVRRFELAHSPRPDQKTIAGRLRETWLQLIIDWRYGYALWPVAIAALCLAGRRREVYFLGFLLLFIFIIWIGFTHLLGRFFAIGVPVAALTIGTLPCRKTWMVSLGTVVTMMLVGWIGLPGVRGSGLHPAISEAAQRFGQKGGFALTDPSWLVPTDFDLRISRNESRMVELEPIISDPKTTIALIGNAMPFIYNVPMSRLSYRTVFDVDGEAGYPDAWLAPDQRGKRPDRYLLIHPDEIHRLAMTYYDVPGFPTNSPEELPPPPFLEQR